MFHRKEREKQKIEPGVPAPEQDGREENCGFYETGNTTPPKEYLGLLIVIMVACIFFGGLGGAAAMLRRGMRWQTAPSARFGRQIRCGRLWWGRPGGTPPVNWIS